jgi:hypothetical protein
MVKLLQHIVVDVHLLFLSSIDPAVIPGCNADPKHASAGSYSSPALGLVGLFQKLLLQDVTQQLQQYVTAGSAASGPAAAPAGQAAALVFDLSRVLREQRKVFKHWLEGILETVTVQCKAVLSGLTSAAEVALLQQQVWAACVHIEETHSTQRAPGSRPVVTAVGAVAPPAQSIDDILTSQYAYNQSNWEAASAAVLASGAAQLYGSGDGAASTAHTYLWCNVFRACFLHQVERLLKCSCDEVLARTKVHIVRVLRQQGVTVDPLTLKITAISSAAASADAASKKRAYDVGDYSGSVSQISSPMLYQLAERIRLQFDQDISRLVADVVEPVSIAYVICRRNTVDTGHVRCSSTGSTTNGMSHHSLCETVFTAGCQHRGGVRRPRQPRRARQLRPQHRQPRRQCGGRRPAVHWRAGPGDAHAVHAAGGAPDGATAEPH